MRSTKVIASLLTVLLCPVIALVSAAAPASAADATRTKSYSMTRYVWIDKFKMCAQVTISGYLKADLAFTPIEGGAYATIYNPRIINPRMSMTLRTSCSATAPYKTWHAANKVSYSNYFYGYTCSYNPSFSASFPWGVSVGVTPDCGDERVARFGQTNTNARRAYKYSWYTDGYALRWTQRKTDTQPTTLKLCTSTSGYLRFVDDAGTVRKTAIIKVAFSDPCVVYSYSS